MKAKRNKNLFAVGVILIVTFIVIGFTSSIRGGSYDVEVNPEITLPEYRTDTARAIDAYESVMDRFIDLTEKNLTGINTDVKDIAKKLVLIDHKLSELSTRMARIEKAIGIEVEPVMVNKPSEAETHNHDKPGLED